MRWAARIFKYARMAYEKKYKINVIQDMILGSLPYSGLSCPMKSKRGLVTKNNIVNGINMLRKGKIGESTNKR